MYCNNTHCSFAVLSKFGNVLIMFTDSAECYVYKLILLPTIQTVFTATLVESAANNNIISYVFCYYFMHHVSSCNCVFGNFCSGD